MFQRILMLFVPLLVLFSCATVTQGTPQNVGVSSTPSGADVFIDGKYVGKTPLRISLSRSSPHSVRVELPGYEPYIAEFSRTANAMTAGNLVIGGPLGFGIDCLSGAVYQLTPTQIHAHLRRSGTNVSLSEIESCEDCFFFAVNSNDVRAECVSTLR